MSISNQQSYKASIESLPTHQLFASFFASRYANHSRKVKTRLQEEIS